jgi:hypothetical protein
MEWVRGGDYDRILGGHYARRGDGDFQADTDAASEYYVNRLWNIYRDASEGAHGLLDRVDGWLKRDEEDEPPG